MSNQKNDPSGKKKNKLTGIIRDFLRGKPTAEGEDLFNKWWSRKPDVTGINDLPAEEKIAMSERVFLRLKENLLHNNTPVIKLERSSGKAGSQKRKVAWMAAAAVLLIIGAGSYIWHHAAPPATEKSEWLVARTKAGEKRKLRLADGTLVILNERSRLSYPKAWNGGKTRQTELEGEAFFEVARDPAHPFIVSSRHAEVRVLGTRFNVMADQPDSSVVVAMQEGKVTLSDDRRDTSGAIYLVKGDVGVWSTEGRLEKEDGIADNENYFSWMNDGGLSFDGTPLSQVITQLKRIYGRGIVLDNPSMMNRKITLQYPKSDLVTILQVIGNTMKTTIVHTGDVYHIR